MLSRWLHLGVHCISQYWIYLLIAITCSVEFKKHTNLVVCTFNKLHVVFVRLSWFSTNVQTRELLVTQHQVNCSLVALVILVIVVTLLIYVKYKLYKQSCSKSVRSQFFVNRVINVWNNLPQDTNFSSFNLFKCAIENMDLSQYLKYDNNI